MKLAVALLACLALAGCGHSGRTVTVKIETPAGSTTGSASIAAIERCRAANQLIEHRNISIEEHNRLVAETGQGHVELIESTKLCLP